MTKTFLNGKLFPSLLEILGTFGELHGPTVTDDSVVAFRPISSAADLFLDYRRTLIPPKKYLLPPCENILDHSPERGYTLPDVKRGEIILFGLHPCDLHGIAYLDRVFMEETPDPHYAARRSRLSLMGISCEPDEFCFCGDVGTEQATGFDLFLRRSPEGFHLVAGSPWGEAMVERMEPFLVEGEAPQVAGVEHETAQAIREASAVGETFPESPLWQEFAERCLACGACSACCPTCYCFDVRENGLLDVRTAVRMREWDNCLFKGHGEVAGGGNFRRSRLERLRYRFLHKYLGFGPLRGVVSCVGCGRCREVCPVKIDLSELFKGYADERP